MDIKTALTTSPPELDFVLPGLPVGTVGAVVAPGATGKTMLLLQLACAIAAGMPCLGHLFDVAAGGAKRQPSKVVLAVAEETREVMHLRLHAVVAQMLKPSLHTGMRPGSATVADLLSENLAVYPLAGVGRLLLDSRGPESGAATLLELAAGSRLLIVDPLRQFHVSDENDAGAMARVVAELQTIATRNGCAVLVAHHTNKSAAFTGTGDQAGAARGSAAFSDAVRWQLNLNPLDASLAAAYGIPESERQDHVGANLAKANYLGARRPQVLRRTAGGAFEPVSLPQAGSRRRNGLSGRTAS